MTTGIILLLSALVGRKMSPEDSPTWWKIIIVMMALAGLLMLPVGGIIAVWTEG